ncbi:MAG: hypothetical protein J6I68_15650 [Butyrivibrio sp.]|uniref:DUF6553 family protein n=1 Tax=Butyrivibrio sp. TaxID=28121 RepID=UPI001B4B5A36|nr:DUF6553 family protein [Butyrivibrio sp.]MBP3784669.1 hypothetical protein [Butyrivibrio sp.]
MQETNEADLEIKYRDKMKAWMMIQVIGQTSVNFLNVKKLSKEMRLYLDMLLGQPPSDHFNGYADQDEAISDLIEFAEYFIDSCKDSKSYRAAIFGTMSMSDAGAAMRLAEDIDQITGRIPEKFGLSESFVPVRRAFFMVFRNKISGAESILSELGIEY